MENMENMEKPLRIELVDAYEMSLKHPDTFEYHTEEEINSIAIGDSVKVNDGKERFWTIIVEINTDHLVGKIDNELCNDQKYNYQSKIIIERRHIYQIRTIKRKEEIREDLNNYFSIPNYTPRYFETILILKEYQEKKN